MSDELCFLGIAESARRIAARRLSPVELTRAYLDRIAAIDGVLDSYLRVTAERALAAGARRPRWRSAAAGTAARCMAYPSP